MCPHPRCPKKLKKKIVKNDVGIVGTERMIIIEDRGVGDREEVERGVEAGVAIAISDGDQESVIAGKFMTNKSRSISI